MVADLVKLRTSQGSVLRFEPWVYRGSNIVRPMVLRQAANWTLDHVMAYSLEDYYDR